MPNGSKELLVARRKATVSYLLRPFVSADSWKAGSYCENASAYTAAVSGVTGKFAYGPCHVYIVEAKATTISYGA